MNEMETMDEKIKEVEKSVQERMEDRIKIVEDRMKMREDRIEDKMKKFEKIMNVGFHNDSTTHLWWSDTVVIV